MKYFAFIGFCFLCNALSGQFNLSGNFQSNNYLDWNGKNLSSPNPETTAQFDAVKGIGLAAEYFYMPDRERQLYYIGRMGANFTLANADYQKIIYPHVGVGLLFYPFNMFGDCDCPRFHQEGTFFSRGFHLAVIANGGLLKIKNQKGQAQGLFEANAGLNIPFGKTQALAPFIGFSLGTSVANNYLQDQKKSTLNQLIIGMRLFFK